MLHGAMPEGNLPKVQMMIVPVLQCILPVVTLWLCELCGAWCSLAQGHRQSESGLVPVGV